MSLFDRFSQECRRCLVEAQQDALCSGHSDIGTDHLLVALIRRSTGTPTEPWRDTPITVEWVLGEMTRYRGPVPALGAPDTNVELSPALMITLEQAVLVANARDSAEIEPTHMLIGLLQGGDSFALDLIRAHDIKPEELCAHLLADTEVPARFCRPQSSAALPDEAGPA